MKQEASWLQYDYEWRIVVKNGTLGQIVNVASEMEAPSK